LIHIIGGGLAGSEITYQVAKAGYNVILHEMRPEVETGVHKTDKLAELVCSNSLKSKDTKNASGLLKKELERIGSFVLEVAKRNAIPGGKALVVDREAFSNEITQILKSMPNVKIVREEVTCIPSENSGDIWVVASGPATSSKLYAWISNEFGKSAHFFDAVAPIVEANTIDTSKAFFANRYEGGTDYLNCPLNREEYIHFREALIGAEVLPIKGFDKKLLFSRCQPIEEIAKSGFDSMRFGPLRPVGLTRSDGKKFYAVVQLRRDNSIGTLYNIVGFQTRLKWPEQDRVFRMIPALKNVKIVRYGVMHANVYIEPYKVTDEFFRAKNRKNLFFAGQITGVEGYVESIASGLYVAINILRVLNGKMPVTFPRKSMIGALMDYVARTPDLKPMYANFGLIDKNNVANVIGVKEMLSLQGVKNEN